MLAQQLLLYVINTRSKSHLYDCFCGSSGGAKQPLFRGGVTNTNCAMLPRAVQGLHVDSS